MSRLSQAISDLRAAKSCVRIVGHDSKSAWYPDSDAQVFNVVEQASGIIDYQPDELVITAFAGTPVEEVQQALAERNQIFAFEPPHFNNKGTLGGMVSSGFSGPARKWAGSVRDAVLGVELINGKGEALRFGGQVMKNVAGYDVSRLIAGSFGWLGVIEAASIRVHPMAQMTTTLTLSMDLQQALHFCHSLQRQYLPLSGTWWVDGTLHIRLAGTESGVAAACQKLGGDHQPDEVLWQEVCDQSHSFFAGSAGTDLYRVIVPAAADPFTGTQEQAFEWGGGLRWLWHENSETVNSWARAQGGWAWRMGSMMPVDENQLKLMQALKAAFDPDGVFANLVLDVPKHQVGDAHAH